MHASTAGIYLVALLSPDLLPVQQLVSYLKREVLPTSSQERLI